MAAKKRKPPTATSHAMIKAALRRYVWLRSPERTAALRSTHNHCADCDAKFTRRKGFEVLPNVHHLQAVEKRTHNGISYNDAIDAIKHILTPDVVELAALCKGCHLARHEET
jgi:hypothetical protein